LDRNLSPSAELFTLPEVTVLLSCYNGERWLGEAIESVLCQTYPNFEFLILDDGSTDGTWGIIQSYANRDPRIIPWKKENTGLAKTLNHGIAMARGKWIARIDADDVCEPTRLAQQMKFLLQNPKVALLGSWSREFYQDGSGTKMQRYPSSNRKLVSNLLRQKRFFPHSSAIFLAELARSIGGYDYRFLRAEDYNFWLQFSTRTQIECVTQALVRIRKHPSQISNDLGGTQQLIDASSALVAHLLKTRFGEKLEEWNDAMWVVFQDWLATQLRNRGILELERFWRVQRESFGRPRNHLLGGALVLKNLLRHGKPLQALGYLWFGSYHLRALARLFHLYRNTDSS